MHFKHTIVGTKKIMHGVNHEVSSLIDCNSNTVTKHLWKKDHTGVSPLVNHGITYTDLKTKLFYWLITLLLHIILKTWSTSLL